MGARREEEAPHVVCTCGKERHSAKRTSNVNVRKTLKDRRRLHERGTFSANVTSKSLKLSDAHGVSRKRSEWADTITYHDKRHLHDGQGSMDMARGSPAMSAIAPEDVVNDQPGNDLGVVRGASGP